MGGFGCPASWDRLGVEAAVLGARLWELVSLSGLSLERVCQSPTGLTVNVHLILRRANTDM